MTEATSFADHADSSNTETQPENNQSSGIVIGDRTFPTQEELVKSWTTAQEHIRTIESENASHKEALSRAKGVEEVLERLKANTATGTQTDTIAAVDNKGYLTEDTLDKVLTTRERERAELSNVNRAMSLAQESLGSDFIAKLDAKAAELSISTDAAMALAKSSPDAFAKLLLPNAPKVGKSSIGDINTSAIPQSSPEAPSMRIRQGAPTSEVLMAWNAAKPNLEE